MADVLNETVHNATTEWISEARKKMLPNKSYKNVRNK